uniref:Uncharacterized protein n=1 Tax=Hyaloperonospora arabidopsidis (strain Emoy2) TaxID=559515 RepID=M4B4K0_HYAAE
MQKKEEREEARLAEETRKGGHGRGQCAGRKRESPMTSVSVIASRKAGEAWDVARRSGDESLSRRRRRLEVAITTLFLDGG